MVKFPLKITKVKNQDIANSPVEKEFINSDYSGIK